MPRSNTAIAVVDIGKNSFHVDRFSRLKLNPFGGRNRYHLQTGQAALEVSGSRSESIPIDHECHRTFGARPDLMPDVSYRLISLPPSMRYVPLPHDAVLCNSSRSASVRLAVAGGFRSERHSGI